jgi:hypothetical protein
MNQAGHVIAGEQFALVEQKVANKLGPMMSKGLIKMEARVRRGQPSVRVVSQVPYGYHHSFAPLVFLASNIASSVAHSHAKRQYQCYRQLSSRGKPTPRPSEQPFHV